MNGDFDTDFELITGNTPFPWQTALYDCFRAGKIPASASIPTGLGKTSVLAVWLLALARAPTMVPRRLVYVVNRRTVVDQTTIEAEKLRTALVKPELDAVNAVFKELCALPCENPLAISTLRGQFADNGEWRTDPARPAVIIGTVDMIGSGLLFSRYTAGFKTRPLHAGFLGQDALLIHDEAHLEPAFQTLLSEIEVEQKRCQDFRPMRVLELTATSRNGCGNTLPHSISEADFANETVQKRINAVKNLSFVSLEDGEKLDEKIISCAQAATPSRAVLIFVRSVETALKIAEALDKNETKGRVVTLTGTMRGKERDELVEKEIFKRFVHGADSEVQGTVYLVATSAGEVGVNISADDCICDLSTYESMAQRFGRINRFGNRDDSAIIVVHETEFDKGTDEKPKSVEIAREGTLTLLKRLQSANSAALAALPADECAAAFSPPPALRIATDIQFDAWALTSIREPIAARPPVASYLHGEAEWQPPEMHLAWRDDCDFNSAINPESFLELFPLRPRELLRDTSKRIVATLKKLLKDKESTYAWLIAENGSVSVLMLSAEDDTLEDRLADATLILPVSLGGLSNNGLFSAAKGNTASDVSGIERRKSDTRERDADFILDVSGEDAEVLCYQLWVAPKAKADFSRKHTGGVETLEEHTKKVAANAAALAEKLLPEALRPALIAAARMHDAGKENPVWQRNIGNTDYPNTILAKSAPGTSPRIIIETRRHEFGASATGLSAHCIAAHHGRARPHFADDEHDNEGLATDIPRAFAALQSQYGRWGLAYLESLLRAADYAASAGIVAVRSLECDDSSPLSSASTESGNNLSHTISIPLDPLNPGHYFACCGLFELASRLDSKTLAWFAHENNQWCFKLANTPPLAELLAQITAAPITVLDSSDATASPVSVGSPFNLRLDWWKTASRATSSLKVWAGTMEAPRIVRAMQKAVKSGDGEKLLFAIRIAYDVVDGTKKVEPFYFDANRGPNSDSRDVGFSANDLSLETLASPAVELLTLIGLQRAIPRPVGDRLFDYHLWTAPLPISLIPAAVNGLLPDSQKHAFRFESWYRTSQKKHKAFLPATPIGGRV